MSERRVLKAGDPELRRIARPVEDFDSPALHTLIQDLWETMSARGGVGLAATQVGEPWRVVVFEMPDAHPRYRDRPAVPRTVLVNPAIEPLDDAMEDGWEGCLSLPGMRGLVPRHRRIRYRGFDERGAPIEREVDGFHARVVQHEVDHLDGVLYPERMTDLSTFGFEDELSLSGVLWSRCE